MTPAPSSPQCAPHQRAAVATCARCGSFLCGDCTELLGESAYCAACVDFVRTHGTASRGLKVLAVLEGLVALSVPLVLGLVWAVNQDGLWGVPLGGMTYSILLSLRLPVLHGVSAGVGLGVAVRELRRVLGVPSARRWARWTLALALVNLGYLVLEGVAFLWYRHGGP